MAIETTVSKQLILDTLIMAKRVISNPDNWCQNDFAKDEIGMPTAPSDPKACKFCSAGAVIKVVNNYDDLYYATTDFLSEVFYKRYGNAIINVNDRKAHSEIMEVWDEAINDLKQELGQS